MVPATDIIQDFYDVFNFAGERSFLERSLVAKKPAVPKARYIYIRENISAD